MEIKRQVMLLALIICNVFYSSYAYSSDNPLTLNTDSVSAIFTDYYGSAAINEEGNVIVWGGDTQYPTQLENINEIKDMVLLRFPFNYYLKKDGTVIDGSSVPLPGGTGVKAIDGSNGILFALKDDGTVLSMNYYGNNNNGQLGRTESEGLYTDLVKIPNLTDVVDIATGSATLVVLSDGTVWAWGYSVDGHLGLDSYDECSNGSECSKTPRQVSTLTNIVAVSAGEQRFMALDTNGSVWVWGEATTGTLGNNTTSQRVRVPQIVPNLSNVIDISAAYYSCLALKADGQVWTWGDAIDGVLWGKKNLVPTQVEGLDSVTGIFSGNTVERVYAIKDDGSVWGWGANGDGLLGDGTDLDQDTPVPVVNESGDGFLNLLNDLKEPTISSLSIEGESEMSAGSVSTYSAQALFSDGRSVTITPIWSSDDNNLEVNTDGRLSSDFSSADRIVELNANYLNGDESISSSKTIIVRANSPIIAQPTFLTNNSKFNLVLLPDGRVKSWGDNSDGQLGVGSRKSMTTPTQVDKLTDIVSITASQVSSYALRDDGSVWGWGGNFLGGLGDGDDSFVDKLSPVQVKDLYDIVYIAPKSNIGGYAMDSNGDLWEWGGSAPQVVSTAPSDFISTVGPLLLSSDGSVWNYQLGHLDKQGELVEGLSNIIEIAVGRYLLSPYTYYALDQNGHVWAWGENNLGQLGDGTQENRDIPAKINLLENIVHISAASTTAYAVDNEGSVWTWGSDQLNGLGGENLLPIKISDLPFVDKISAGMGHALALMQDGTLRSWGRNREGQLGDGTFEQSRSPVLVLNDSVTGFLDLDQSTSNSILTEAIPKFLLATDKEGDLGSLSLGTNVYLGSIDLGEQVMASRQFRAPSQRSSSSLYKIFVAAFAGDGLPIPAGFYFLNSNANWSYYTSGAIPEYLSNIDSILTSHVDVSILDDVDVSDLIGTQIYVGYGTDDQEMVSAGRYRAIYTVQE